jgi:hypothetical protein
MLFNQSTGKPKADVLSTASLIAWLEQQVPSDRYNYEDSRCCVLAQYFKAQGYKGVKLMPYMYTYKGLLAVLGYKTLPTGWEYVASGDWGGGGWTFGDALERAKVLEDA